MQKYPKVSTLAYAAILALQDGSAATALRQRSLNYSDTPEDASTRNGMVLLIERSLTMTSTTRIGRSYGRCCSDYTHIVRRVGRSDRRAFSWTMPWIVAAAAA